MTASSHSAAGRSEADRIRQELRGVEIYHVTYSLVVCNCAGCDYQGSRKGLGGSQGLPLNESKGAVVILS